MKYNQTSWIGFLITIAALNAPSVGAIATQTSLTNSANSNTLESRLARLATTLKEKENQVSETTQSPTEVARGWLNGAGRRGFVNGRRGGWGDGYRGGFGNIHPWRNGWRDGGGFYRYRY